MADGLIAGLVRHRGALLRYLRARGAGADAEDLLQELWLKIDGLPEAAIGNDVGYLYRMAHNLMLDRYRASVRREGRERRYVEDGGSDPVDQAPLPDRSLVAREMLHRVEAALHALGERTDHIFRRHRIDGVAQRDIAAELGISLSAVEKHLQKAYKTVASIGADGGARDGGDHR